jgi:hypothetical protein
MEANVLLPELLVHRLERLAQEEGTSLDRLIQRLVSEHLERRKGAAALRSEPRKSVRLPLISKEETGVIMPVTGADLDEIFACDDLAS